MKDDPRADEIELSPSRYYVGMQEAARKNNGRPSPKLPFPGNSRIFCSGRVVTSPAYWWLALTFSMFSIPLILFSVFMLKDYLKVMPAWTAVVLYLLIPVPIFTCVKTAVTDPGILPRGLHPRDSIQASIPEDERLHTTLITHQNNPEIVVGKEVLINGRSVYYKYCSTCEIFRPPRASHCGVCNNCVEEFDHHCPWLSNCIGRRNMRSFVHFIASTAFACIGFTLLLALYLTRDYSGEVVGEFVLFHFSTLLFAVYVSALGMALLGLTLYYCILIAKGLTSNEQIKRSRGADITSPLEANSCSANFKRVFWDKIPDKSIAWKMYM